MGKVFADQSRSLDGFSTGPDVRMDNPMGDGGEGLHAWQFRGGHASTRTTERYSKVSEESVREIASALDSVISDSFSDSSRSGSGAGGSQILGNVGAGNGGRTRDIHLGKVALYH